MTTVGRNDPCPCGSGLKYKKDPDQAAKRLDSAQPEPSGIPPEIEARLASEYYEQYYRRAARPTTSRGCGRNSGWSGSEIPH